MLCAQGSQLESSVPPVVQSACEQVAPPPEVPPPEPPPPEVPPPEVPPPEVPPPEVPPPEVPPPEVPPPEVPVEPPGAGGPLGRSGPHAMAGINRSNKHRFVRTFFTLVFSRPRDAH